MTNLELLIEIQRLLIEAPYIGESWPSGLWSLSEVLGYCEQRQQRFLRESRLLESWAEQDLIPGQAEQPVDPIVLQRVWHGLVEDHTGRCTPLSLSGQAAMDHLLQARLSPGTPRSASWSLTGTNTLSLMPPPLASGRLHLFGVPVAEDARSLGADLTVPADWSPFLRAGIMADMLGKQGRAYDPDRAARCEARFTEGIQVAQVLAAGFLP